MRVKPKISYWFADSENTVPKSTLYNKESYTENDLYNIWEEAQDTPFTLFWSAGIVPISENPKEEECLLFDTSNGNYVFYQLIDFLDQITETYPICFFHNFAYDGMGLIQCLMELGYKESPDVWHIQKGEYGLLASGEGLWYSLKYRSKRSGRLVEFRDSLKLIPMSEDTIAKQLKTKAQKLKGEIDYSEERVFGHAITVSERKYLINDLLIMAEALGMMEEYGLLNFLTIGSFAMHDFITRLGGGDYKKGKKKYRSLFPELPSGLTLEEKEATMEEIMQYEVKKYEFGHIEYEYPAEHPEIYGKIPTDWSIRKAYKGGWCYNNTDGRIYNCHGYVADVNSLYPSVMREHWYPIGYPVEHPGEEFDSLKRNCYIVKGKFDLQVKKGHLPFIQIKQSRFRDNEYLKSTDGIVELTLTRPDYELLCEQYNILYEDIQCVWVFDAKKDIFNEFIDHWYAIKKNAPNKCIRLLAKLTMNSSYGKFAQSALKSAGHYVFNPETACLDKYATYELGSSAYIPVGAFITAYARCYTIRGCQKNYKNFLYADTDSMHLSAPPVGIPVGKEIGEWDIETEWDCARFVRQKTYIEYTTVKDGEPCEPYLLIRACGASQDVKDRLCYKVTEFKYGIVNGHRVEVDHKFQKLIKDEDHKIINEPRPYMDVIIRFKPGLKEAGKLMKKRVGGGYVLEETTFSINPV